MHEDAMSHSKMKCVIHVKSPDLWFFVKTRDVPLHHLLHAVVGILFDCSPENKRTETDAPP